MIILTSMSAAVFALLGALHLIYTLRDFLGTPRFFRPTNRDLLEAMRASKTALAPKGRDYWSGILGFHFSHSIGVLLFALLIVIAGQYQIIWLQPLLVLVGAIFTLIAWRFWFSIPLAGCLIGTLLMTAGWII